MKRPARQIPSGAIPRRHARIALRIVLMSLGVAALLLLLGAAVTRRLLSGPQLRAWINTEPESTLLDYDEATSIWPGRLFIKNLRIRGSDRNVQYIIRLAEARVDYSLAALFTRRFHALRVRGSGLSFRLRNKLARDDRRKPPMALLPPIPGFADPPLRSEEPERTVDPGDPWSIEIENLTVDRLEEIWIDVYHYRGNAALRGGFFLRPGLLARVGPASVDVAGGEVRVGKDPGALGLTGKLTALIDSYDPRIVRGSAVWKKISGGVKLDGHCESMRFLNFYLPSSPEPRLEGGAGALRLAVKIEHGIARGDARLTAHEARARYADGLLSGDADVSLRIARWDLETGPLEIAGSRIELSDVTAVGANEARRWWGRLEFVSGRVAGGISARIQVRCRDARPLFTMLGTNLPKWTRRLLELDGLSATAAVTLAPSLARVRGLEAEGGGFRIEGDYTERGRSRRGLFLIDTGPLNVGVRIRDEQTSVRLIGARDWFEKERGAESPVSEGRPAPTSTGP